MKLGFGLMLNDFKIDKFPNLVPAIDSIMPLMRDISGIIDADLAATVDVDSNMNMVLPTLDAAVKLQGRLSLPLSMRKLIGRLVKGCDSATVPTIR